MSEYTPGPWKVRKTLYGQTYIEGKDGDFVCAFPPKYGHKKDVVIIAAAPEMVTLLNAALCEMQNSYAEKWITSGTRMVANNIATLLRHIEGEEETE